MFHNITKSTRNRCCAQNRDWFCTDAAVHFGKCARKNRSQYDEKILKALVYTLSVYPVGTAVQLSNKSRGLVMKTDPTKPRCPIVRVILDPEGKTIDEPQMIQVSDGQGLTIAGVLGAEEAKELKELA